MAIIRINNKEMNPMSDNRRQAMPATTEPKPPRLNYTITPFLYWAMSEPFREGIPAKVPKALRLTLRLAADMVGIWNAAHANLEKKLGHDDFEITSIDFYESGEYETHWEPLEPVGPQPDGRTTYRAGVGLCPTLVLPWARTKRCATRSTS